MKHTTHFRTICLALFRPDIGQNLSRIVDSNIVGPQCNNSTCLSVRINLFRQWLAGRIIGCFVAKSQLEFCILPPTRSKPFFRMNGFKLKFYTYCLGFHHCVIVPILSHKFAFVKVKLIYFLSNLVLPMSITLTSGQLTSILSLE